MTLSRPLSNWAGNHVYRGATLVEPTSVDELRDVVRTASRLRVLGSRHSFNDIVDSEGDLVSLARMPPVIEIDAGAGRVTVAGAVRYGELCRAMDGAGVALPSLASLPHITVAGSCATATHGSGDRAGNLATSVVAMDVVTADGGLVRVGEGSEDAAVPLEGAVVSLGVLGVVTAVTLRTEPRYTMRQVVYERVPLAAVLERFDDVTTLADSVSAFTTWRVPVADQVWLKRRDDGRGRAFPATVFGGTPAREPLHPIRALPSDACTEQLGVPGPWHERLPHFRLDHTPSSGAELQSEYLLGREHAGDAIEAMLGIGAAIGPLVQVSEIRTVAADRLWLSPSYERPSVAIHVTWVADWPAVREALPIVEAALAPFAPRPHWGKLFTMDAELVRAAYPRRADFAALAARVDPRATFTNAFVRRYVLDGASSAGGD